jgi:hypothetical protein
MACARSSRFSPCTGPGLGLLRRRAAILSALALGSLSALSCLESRQIVSDMPLIAALALAVGGFGRYAWPADGVRRLRDLIIACAGLGMGLLSGGALLGVVLPCLALAGSLLVGFGLRPRQEGAADGLCAPGRGQGCSRRRRFWPRALCARRAWPRGSSRGGCPGHPAFHLTLATANVAGKFSLLLGGVPRAGTPATTFEFFVRQLGFGLFPWSALAVFALGRPLIRLGGGNEPDGDRLAFVQLYLLVFAAFGFALSSFSCS